MCVQDTILYTRSFHSCTEALSALQALGWIFSQKKYLSSVTYIILAFHIHFSIFEPVNLFSREIHSKVNCFWHALFNVFQTCVCLFISSQMETCQLGNQQIKHVFTSYEPHDFYLIANSELAHTTLGIIASRTCWSTADMASFSASPCVDQHCNTPEVASSRTTREIDFLEGT